jgi:hypothetical protein
MNPDCKYENAECDRDDHPCAECTADAIDDEMNKAKEGK